MLRPARRTASNAAGRFTAVSTVALVKPTTAGRWRATAPVMLVDGQVGAEQADVVARVADDARGHLEPDDVVLALRAREQDASRPALARDAERLAQQHRHPHRDRGREVLVGDGDASLGPEVADQHERGPDDVVVDQRLAEAGVDRLADDALGGSLLAGQHGVGVRALELRGAPKVALLAPALLVVVIGDHLMSPAARA